MLITLGRTLDFFPALAPLQLGKVTIGASLLYVLLFASSSLARNLKNNPFMPYIAIFVLLAAAGVPFSVWRGGAFESFGAYLKTICIFALLCALADGKFAPSLRRAAIVTVAMLTALMLAAKGTGRVQVSETYDPNDIALLFVTFLPLVTAEALAGHKMLRIPVWGAAVAAVAAIALTQSRGGVIALTAVAVHAILLAGKRAWLLIPLIGAACVLFLAYSDPQLWERFQELRGQSDYNFDARSGRLEIWKQGLQLMLGRPLFGVGIGQFSSALGMIGSGVFKAAHNSYIQIGAELGLPGFCVYLAMLLRARRICLTALAAVNGTGASRMRWQALRLALTGFAVGSFFLSQAYGAILYALLALVCAMSVEHEREAAPAHSHAPKPEKPAPDRAIRQPGQQSERQPEPSLAMRAEAARAAREALLRRGDERRTAKGEGA